jgi:hypothetical protein
VQGLNLIAIEGRGLIKSQKHQDRPFWRTGGKDMDHLANLVIVSGEVNFFMVQSPES